MSQGTHLHALSLFALSYTYHIASRTLEPRSFSTIVESSQNHALTMTLTHIDPVIVGSSRLSDFGKDLQPSKPLHVTRSFSRFEPPGSGPSMYRLQDTIPLEPSPEDPTPEMVGFSTLIKSGSVEGVTLMKPDSDVKSDDKGLQAAPLSLSAGTAETFDDLPIELISLTDRSGFVQRYNLRSLLTYSLGLSTL